ncbi:ABC transporter substrate-binding protein [Nakamurella leprariae]|uniref:ABC transporter substrate-binding protein n=1 Tax=Nakamurella leprariae TaxID=2803911 RepID=A0A939BX79_9ACTN|nr:ABC transporter substrate-binding protein [Nakamurella leprariae]MBM9465700.1 ABC transporter substrate-binding protein [Nakamurella leprariae]
MSTRSLRITLCAALVATTLAACGGGTADGGGDQGSGGGTIKLGAFSPLSGPAVSSSSGVKATEAAIRKLNDAGGINGHKLEFIVKDDQYDPAKTPGVTRELVESDNVAMMCGPQGSVPFGAVKDYLAARKVPSIVNAGAPTLAGEYSYLVSSPFDGLGGLLADYAMDELGTKNIAIAYSEDILGTSALEGAKKALSEVGAQPAGEVKFDVSATDFSAQAIQLKGTNADFVIMPGAQANVAGQLINAAEKIGYQPKWGLSYASQNQTLLDLTGGALDGRAFFATPYISPESAVGQDYVATLNKYFPEVETSSGATIAGYTIGEVCLTVLQAAVDEAGGDVPSSEDIQKVMNNMSIDNDYIKGINWTTDGHEGARSAQILALVDGKFETDQDYSPLPE